MSNLEGSEQNAGKWHTNITVGDLHYLRSKFAESFQLNTIHLSSFIKATESFYSSGQFRVNGDHFLTWAFLEPEWEFNHLLGNLDYIEHMTNGNPWIIEAKMPGRSLSAMRELRHLIPTKILRFKRGDNAIGMIKLP